MISFLMEIKNGKIFINAAAGDHQSLVIRRAARIALRENKPVNFRVINSDEYRSLNVDEAKRIMTPGAWIEEMRDSLSDPLGQKEISTILTRSLKKQIVAGLKKQQRKLHERCLIMNREVDKTRKILNV